MYYMCYSIASASNYATASGHLVEDLKGVRDIAEGYAIQRLIGYQLFLYAVPSTFLAPYILEGLFAITAPWYFMKKIVRSREDLVGRNAERSMVIFLPMDMGRYTDITINMVIAVLFTFLPLGYWVPIFFILLISHLYIYAYDHYRILRCTPGFTIESYSVEKAGQYLISVPCGILLSSLFYNQECAYVAEPAGCITFCMFLFFVHVVIHCAIIKFVVPLCITTDELAREGFETQWEDIAKYEPCSWFSANPIHCLRSADIYKDNPPCSYFFRGREHFMVANPNIGQHFSMQNVMTRKSIRSPPAGTVGANLRLSDTE
jgi:hypothetical protein